mmetsp:Transcript_20701/g.58057  ORF Transcript_20701/g.58057 Transcript_20701/m.58057 type:complete len:265 (-) Transcript_20701:212-1006(-)
MPPPAPGSSRWTQSHPRLLPRRLVALTTLALSSRLAAAGPAGGPDICSIDGTSLLQVAERVQGSSERGRPRRHRRHQHPRQQDAGGPDLRHNSTPAPTNGTAATDAQLAPGALPHADANLTAVGTARGDPEAGVGNPGECSVLFCNQDNFHKCSTVFGLGAFSAADAKARGFAVDSVSSFRVTGAPECLLTLYGWSNGFSRQTWMASFGPGEWDTEAAQANGFVDDDTSSFRLDLLLTSTTTRPPGFKRVAHAGEDPAAAHTPA